MASADSCSVTWVPLLAGLFIALLGLAATDPQGTRLFLQRHRERINSRAWRLRRWLAKRLPWLRPRGRALQGAASGSVSAVGTLTVSDSVTSAWNTEGSTAEQLEMIRARVDKAETRLAEVEAAVVKERGEREQALLQVEAALREDLSELRRSLAERERAAADLNARGLPVLVSAIVLGAVPESIWCSGHWAVAWLAAVGLSAFAVIRTKDVWRGATETQ